jgi:hypothetical protein
MNANDTFYGKWDDNTPDKKPLVPVAKSRDEIEDLKRQWRKDPHWDIEETEGFEAHREELKAYNDEMQNEWAAQRKERIVDDMGKMGITSEKTYWYLKRLEQRLESLEKTVFGN